MSDLSIIYKVAIISIVASSIIALVIHLVDRNADRSDKRS